MRLKLAAFLSVALGDARAQDTTFWDATGEEVRTSDACTWYRVKSLDPDTSGRWLWVDKSRSGVLRWEQRSLISDSGGVITDGIERRYYEDGQVRLEIRHNRGKMERVACYWPDGGQKRLDIYQGDSLLSGTCYQEDGKPAPHTPFLEQPVFQNGMDSLYAHMRREQRYPDEAYKKKIQGRVLVQFTVDNDGSIKNAKVISPVHPLLDAEALRIVEGMPRWQPGRRDGDPVKCRFNLPIVFKLNY